MGYWLHEDEETDDWMKRYNDRERAKARYRLKDKLKALLNISEEDAREVVELIEEMDDEAKEDVYDRVKERGQYDRDW